jgi:peptidoglycan/xylan/chitin deacetylase (PgdA/CDA1 family)
LAEYDVLRPSEPDLARFERIVEFLVKYFNVLPLSEAVRLLRAGHLPAACACITFDDGYADNLTLAAPVLRRHGAVATVFVATAFVDGGRMFNDSIIEAIRALPDGDADWREFALGQHQIEGDASRLEMLRTILPDLKYRTLEERTQISHELARRAGLAASSDLMLSRRQLIEWRDLGFEVGGHTVNHPILSQLNQADAWREVALGRDQLTHWLGAGPDVFAYPNGAPGRDYGPREIGLVKRAGYHSAVSTVRGAATRHVDVYQLPRFTPWDRSMWSFALRSAQTLVNARRALTHNAEENKSEVRT